MSSLLVPPASASLRAQVQALDPNAAIISAGTMRDLYGPSVANPRFSALLMSTFALLALLTAAVCLHGMLAYTVSRRTAEIGVRMALGADRSDVTRLVVVQALASVVAGLAIGMVAAQALSRFLVPQLYRTTTYDPLSLAFVVVAFVIVAAVAAYVPARRATRVDPVAALRAE